MTDLIEEVMPQQEIELLLLLRRTLLELPITVELLRQQMASTMLPSIPTMLERIQQRLHQLAPDNHHLH